MNININILVALVIIMYTLINLSFVTVKVREVTKHKNKIDTNPPEARFEDVKYASFQLNFSVPWSLLLSSKLLANNLITSD